MWEYWEEGEEGGICVICESFLISPLKQKAPSAPGRGRSFLSFYEQAGLSESHLGSLATLETDEETLLGVGHALTLEVVVNSFTGSGICLNSLYT